MKYALILTFLITQLVQAQSPLMPYRKGKLWGYADTTGKIVVQPQYDRVDLYRDDFPYAGIFFLDSATIRSYEPKYKMGIIKKTGQVIIPPTDYKSYDIISRELYPFGEEYFVPEIEKSKHWFTNTKVSERIPIIFLAKKRSSAGQDTIYIYDSTGKKIIDKPFNNVQTLSFDGKAVMMMVQLNDNYGVLTQTGKLTIPSQYQYLKCLEIDSFNQYILVKKDGKYGLINDKNKTIVAIHNDEFNFLNIGTKEEKVLILRKGKQEAAFSLKGKVLQPFVNGKIENIYDYEKGYKLVVDSNYYVDNRDQSIGRNESIAPVPEEAPYMGPDKIYDRVEMQTYNPIIFEKEGKFGIKINDAVTLPAIYDEVKIANPKRGTYSNTFDTYSNFYQNDTALCFIKTNGKLGLANMYGKILIPIVYKEIKPLIEFKLSESKFIVKNKKNKFGVVNFANTIVIPITFDTITTTYTDINYRKEISYTASHKNGTSIFSSDGKLVKQSKFNIIETLLNYGNWENRTWKVKATDGVGVIDFKDSIIIAIKYKYINTRTFVPNNIMYEVTNNDNLLGLCQLNGAPFVACKYEEIVNSGFKDKKLIAVVRNAKYGIVSLTNGEEVIPCKYKKLPQSTYSIPEFFVIQNENREEGLATVANPDFLPPIKGSKIIYDELNIVNAETAFVPYKTVSNQDKYYGLIFVKKGVIEFQTPEIYDTDWYKGSNYRKYFKFMALSTKNGIIDYIGYNGVRFFED